MGLLKMWCCQTYQVIQNLITNDSDHLEALLTSHRVDDHVPVDANVVLAVEKTVFVLAGGVDHLDSVVLVAESEDFAECVFNGGVVRVDKVPVDELHREGALA
jgi:hypothetical protein